MLGEDASYPGSQVDAAVNVSEWTGIDGLDAALSSSGTGSPILSGTVVPAKGGELCFITASKHGVPVGSPEDGYDALLGGTMGDLALVLATKTLYVSEDCTTAWIEATPNGDGWDTQTVAFTLGQ